MVNLLKLKMKEYQHTCVLVNQNILNILFDFGCLLNDGFGYYLQGNQGRLSFDRFYLTTRVVGLISFLIKSHQR